MSGHGKEAVRLCQQITRHAFGPVVCVRRVSPARCILLLTRSQRSDRRFSTAQQRSTVLKRIIEIIRSTHPYDPSMSSDPASTQLGPI